METTVAPANASSGKLAAVLTLVELGFLACIALAVSPISPASAELRSYRAAPVLDGQAIHDLDWWAGQYLRARQTPSSHYAWRAMPSGHSAIIDFVKGRLGAQGKTVGILDGTDTPTVVVQLEVGDGAREHYAFTWEITSEICEGGKARFQLTNVEKIDLVPTDRFRCNVDCTAAVDDFFHVSNAEYPASRALLRKLARLGDEGFIYRRGWRLRHDGLVRLRSLFPGAVYAHDGFVSPAAEVVSYDPDGRRTTVIVGWGEARGTSPIPGRPKLRLEGIYREESRWENRRPSEKVKFHPSLVEQYRTLVYSYVPEGIDYARCQGKRRELPGS
jgi:hypothetical protein